MRHQEERLQSRSEQQLAGIPPRSNRSAVGLAHSRQAAGISWCVLGTGTVTGTGSDMRFSWSSVCQLRLLIMIMAVGRTGPDRVGPGQESVLGMGMGDWDHIAPPGSGNPAQLIPSSLASCAQLLSFMIE